MYKPYLLLFSPTVGYWDVAGYLCYYVALANEKTLLKAGLRHLWLVYMDRNASLRSRRAVPTPSSSPITATSRTSRRTATTNNITTAATTSATSGEDRLGDNLRRMSRSNRASFLRTLSQSLDLGDAHYLLELLRVRLVVDPLGELPVEVQLRVLWWMENPVDVLRMARCCRSWNRVALDSHLWACLVTRKMRPTRVTRTMLEEARPIITHSNINNINNNQLCQQRRKFPPPVESCWLAIKYETLLQRNWQEATFSTTTIGAHGSSVITSLKLDEEENVLLSASDNGTIGVWTLQADYRRAFDDGDDEEEEDDSSSSSFSMLNGHQGGVWALASWGTLLVTGSTDRSLIVWDWRRGQRLMDLVGHTSTVRCAAMVGKDQCWVASGSRDGTVRVWDLTSQEHERCRHILTGHTGSVRCLAPWGDFYLVSGSYDGTLRVWDLREGRCVAMCAGHDGKVYSVATTRNYIFSGGIDGKIRVWNPETGQQIDVFSDHTALVGLLEVSPRGDRLVAASTDGSLSLWDTHSLVRLRHIELAHRASITALGINEHVVISGADHSLKLWPLSELEAGSVDDPVEPILLADKMETIWKIEVGESHAAVAYQQGGESCLTLYDFHPFADGFNKW